MSINTVMYSLLVTIIVSNSYASHTYNKNVTTYSANVVPLVLCPKLKILVGISK